MRTLPCPGISILETPLTFGVFVMGSVSGETRFILFNNLNLAALSTPVDRSLLVQKLLKKVNEKGILFEKADCQSEECITSCSIIISAASESFFKSLKKFLSENLCPFQDSTVNSSSLFGRGLI